MLVEWVWGMRLGVCWVYVDPIDNACRVGLGNETWVYVHVDNDRVVLRAVVY